MYVSVCCIHNSRLVCTSAHRLNGQWAIGIYLCLLLVLGPEPCTAMSAMLDHLHGCWGFKHRSSWLQSKLSYFLSHLPAQYSSNFKRHDIPKRWSTWSTVTWSFVGNGESRGCLHREMAKIYRERHRCALLELWKLFKLLSLFKGQQLQREPPTRHVGSWLMQRWEKGREEGRKTLRHLLFSLVLLVCTNEWPYPVICDVAGFNFPFPSRDDWQWIWTSSGKWLWSPGFLVYGGECSSYLARWTAKKARSHCGTHRGWGHQSLDSLRVKGAVQSWS